MTVLSQRQIEKIISLVYQAGCMAVELRKGDGFVVSRKSDNSFVSNADIAIGDFLTNSLRVEFPDIAVICEENFVEQQRENLFQVSDLYWSIDPIDGTSSFVNGGDDFAVSVALIKGNKAIFGIMHAPLFEGGKTVYMNHNQQVILVSANQEKHLQNLSMCGEAIRLVISHRIKDNDLQLCLSWLQSVTNTTQPIVVEKINSAVLKFLRVIEGKADIYLNLRPSMQWDSAAGQALLENLSGLVVAISNNDGQISLLDSLSCSKNDFSNPPFIATNSKICQKK